MKGTKDYVGTLWRQNADLQTEDCQLHLKILTQNPGLWLTGITCVLNWDLSSVLGWSLGRLCFGRGGGYDITNTLMTFFSRSFLSSTLGGKKTIKSNDKGFECRGTNVYWMRALSGKMFELFHIRTEHYWKIISNEHVFIYNY